MAVLFEERQQFIARGLAHAVLAALAATILALWFWIGGTPGAPPVLILLGPLLALVLVVWMELHVVVNPEARADRGRGRER